VVGLGGGGMELLIGPESPNFDEMNIGNEGLFCAQYSTWLSMAGVRANYRLGVFDVGVNLAYLFSFADSWTLAGEEIENFPDVDLSGLRLSISIGSGGYDWVDE